MTSIRSILIRSAGIALLLILILPVFTSCAGETEDTARSDEIATRVETAKSEGNQGRGIAGTYQSTSGSILLLTEDGKWFLDVNEPGHGITTLFGEYWHYDGEVLRLATVTGSVYRGRVEGDKIFDLRLYSHQFETFVKIK